MSEILPVVVCSVAAAIAVALAGLAVLGTLVQRSRQRAEARLDGIQRRVLEIAIALSDQTRDEGAQARIRLIRAAHAAMSEQQAEDCDH